MQILVLDAGICTRSGLRGRGVIVTLPAMGYPERLLSADEAIAGQFRPHWSSLLREILLATLVVVLIGLLAANDFPVLLLLALVIAVISLIARGLITRFTTIHVITNAASQLETVSRLHDEGKLTNQEFDDQKRKLLEE